MVNAESLKKGGLLLGVLLIIFIAFYASLMIGGLVVGSVAETAVGTWNGTAGGGSVTLSPGMKDALVTTETSYITDATSLQGNAALIIGLIAIVIIMLVFGFKFNFGMGKKGGVN